MKQILILITFFCFQFNYGQLKVNVKKAKINKTKIELQENSYAMVHPKEIVGTYLLKKTSTFGSLSFNYEYEINLNLDGTCKTRYYKSNMRVGPKNKTTKCKWGLAINSTKMALKTKKKDNETWYEIILESTESNKKLQYYDRVSYYDYIIISKGKKPELRLIFADEKNGRIKKQ